MREELFYKDATPKAEHFISFVVQLPLSRRRKGLAQSLSEAPLDLELMYAPSAPGEDYLPVPDQSHLRAAASPVDPRAAENGSRYFPACFCVF